MSSNLGFWKPIVGESWYNNNTGLFDSDYAKELINTLAHDYKTTNVFPLQKDVFKAFKMTPFNKVRVVILGTIPYEGYIDGHPIATGLAFGHKEDSFAVNTSLANMFGAIERTCYDGLKVNFDFSLKEWAEQGVLLLNESLTFNEFKGSRTALWGSFIEYIMQSLNASTSGLHFVFIGEKVKKYSKFINPKIHHRYAVSDPSTFKTIGKNWECDVFKKISDDTVKQNGEEFRLLW